MTLPGWIRQLEKAPRTNVIVGATALTFGVSFFVWAIQMGTAKLPSTMSAEWIAGNKEFMKFQRNNPIFGASRGHD